MKTIGILQPSYLPWLGYFDYIDRCDAFVFLDTVQYDKHGWRNRNKIKTKDGWQWLTVPVLTKNRMGQLVKDVKIDNTQNWKETHLKSIEQNYSKTKYFNDYIDIFHRIYLEKDFMGSGTLSFVANNVINFISTRMGIGVSSERFLSAAFLNIEELDRNIRLLKICQHHKADRYLATTASKNYLDVGLFEKNGVEVEFQDYVHPTYPQLYGDFISHLSVVDLLFNCGPESLDIIRSTRK